MTETYDYDVAVIGAGPAGYVAAIRASQLGARACCIEKADLGGVCTNVGCIPTKALWYAAHVMTEVGRAAEFGVTVDAPRLDFAATSAHRDGVIKKLQAGIQGLLKANGVELVRGAAAFKDPHTLTVAADEGDREISAANIFVATGSRPIELPMARFDHKSILDSSDAVTATDLPDSVIIVGGGYIGIEFAGIYAAYGIPTMVVEALDSILPGIDADCAKLVHRTLKRRGVKVHTGAAIESVQTGDDGVAARLADGTELTAHRMLVCVGRRADCTGLAIENAGLEPGEKGQLPVNEHMQTAVPHIYAIGDACGEPLLAHVGSQEGLVAAAHATGTITAEIDYAVVPACVFSFPEIASVGMSEQRATETVGKITVKKFPFLALGKAHIQSATDGFVKMIAEAATGRLLGVHICADGASMLLGEAALALQLECTAEELADTIHAHPTMPEAIREAAEGIVGMPINWRG